MEQPDEKFLASVISQDMAKMREALEAGADINCRDMSSPNKFTALLFASRTGESGIIDELIKKGADVNLADSTGFTPLMGAAWFGKSGALLSLIKAGAFIDAVNQNGNTAMMEAASMGHVHIVADLIKSGASLTKINYSGKSVHDIARPGDMRAMLHRDTGFIVDMKIRLKKLLWKFGSR
ncbi:MAG: ankyrin repeat domain-containing protein [Candidatus Goldiibacteriota bacterium]|jgi:ankyrin repeat protein